MADCCFQYRGNLFSFEEETDINTQVMLYPTSTDSDISGYKLLVNSNADINFDVPSVDISTGTITGTEQLIASLSTGSGVFIGDLGTINITTIGNIKRVSGTGVAEFYFKIYHRDSAGAEVLIGTSNSTQQISTPNYAEFSASALMDNGSFDVTDRIVVKYYANRISGGSDPTYNFQFGGDNPIRTIIPAAISNIVVEDKTDEMTLDFTGGVLTYSFYAPYAMKITSVTNVLNSPTTTITKNASAYTLNTNISIGDLINITVSTSSVVRLNIYKL